MGDTRFLVILPAGAAKWLDKQEPLPDASSFIDEWMLSLNPVGSVTRAASTGALEKLVEWETRAAAVVSVTASRLLREVAKESQVADALRQSKYAPLVADDGSLDDRALPVLLGLAVVATMQASVGMKSAEIRNQWRRKRAAAQRRSDSGASEQPPALSRLTDDELSDEPPSSIRPLLDEIRRATGTS